MTQKIELADIREYDVEIEKIHEQLNTLQEVKSIPLNYFKIAAFVQNHLQAMAEKYPDERHNPTYRWEHTQRVAQ
ncbi:MAG: hypothetical protein ACE5GO_10060 [Anaerolineales bacterium]